MTKLLTFFGSVGRVAFQFFTEVTRMSMLAVNSFYWLFLAPLGGRRGLRREVFSKQLVFAGNESLGIAALVSCCVGAVLALQAAYQLKQFGAILYTGALVNVSMARELGPVVTAIVIAGRVGASIAAELGTMQVSEEVDALTTMGIPPIPYLVVPRILALAVMLPCLTILCDAIGMFGGFLIGTLGLHISGPLYFNAAFDAMVPKDILTGIAKSVVFAVMIGLIATYQGLSVKGGAEGVGKATTQSVVYSIITIIAVDCICTALFFYVFV